MFVRGRRKKIVESVRVLPDFRLLSRGSVFRTVKAGDVFGEIIHRALCSSEVRGRVGLSDPLLPLLPRELTHSANRTLLAA